MYIKPSQKLHILVRVNNSVFEFWNSFSLLSYSVDIKSIRYDYIYIYKVYMNFKDKIYIFKIDFLYPVITC